VAIERVLREYARIAFADIAQAYDADGNLLPVQQMPEDIRRVLTGVEIAELFNEGEQIGRLKKVRFAPKVPALDSLAKHLGMFQDGNTAVGVSLQITLNLGSDGSNPALDVSDSAEG
jgi:phage terminase small subunit